MTNAEASAAKLPETTPVMPEPCETKTFEPFCGARQTRPIKIHTQTERGGTGNQTWHGSHILAAFLSANKEAVQDKTMHCCCTLELGAGTGQLALALAGDGWRRIIATDGEPGVVRNLKRNVQANRLGHAVRCQRWNWEDAPPSGLDLAEVDLCVGSDLVYYDRSHSMLAKLLKSVLTARSPSDARQRARVMLLSTIRRAERDSGGQVFHQPSRQGYVGSSLQNFIESELPLEGLLAEEIPVPDAVFDNIQDLTVQAALETADARACHVLHEISSVDARPQDD